MVLGRLKHSNNSVKRHLFILGGKGKMKYHDADSCFIKCFTGVICVMSAAVDVVVGTGFNSELLSLGGCIAFMSIAVYSFASAYAEKSVQVKEILTHFTQKRSRLDHIFDVERFYTEIFKGVE
jgi:hypothetical protein